jgi:hypothetical protein
MYSLAVVSVWFVIDLKLGLIQVFIVIVRFCEKALATIYSFGRLSNQGQFNVSVSIKEF